MMKMLLTTIVSLALLGYFTCSGQDASSPSDEQCFSWWDSCQGQYFCGNVSAYQEYQNTSSSTLLCLVPIPSALAPSPGECVFVPSTVSSESGSCQFVNPCAATLTSCGGAQYQCNAVASGVVPPTCFLPSPPPPTQPCASANGSCEFFKSYCFKWPGFCNSGYQCGTTVDYFKFITGPIPLCVLPENPAPPPPGECIFQSGECVWSECTSWLDYCQTYWTCGTQYESSVYFAGPLPPCAAPPPGYTPPLEPAGCQYNVTAGQCEYTAPPCDGVDCPNGSACVVDPATSQPYCQPSCEIANGGCTDDQICNLVAVLCVTSPCPPQVVCSGPVSTCLDNPTIEGISCSTGYSCVVDLTTNQPYCLPSCDLSNGGCPTGEECSLVSVQCFVAPCPPQVVCTPTENTTDPCAAVFCKVGHICVSSSATGDASCQPSCAVDNGGCQEDEQCSLVLVPCPATSCPPEISCTPTVNVTDPCIAVTCVVGTACVSDIATGGFSCVPLCEIDNGGCAQDETCAVVFDEECGASFCPPKVICNQTETTTNPCIAAFCPDYTYCEFNSATGNYYCKPSCDINNGGCGEDESCTLVDTECDAVSCLPEVICNKTEVIDPCATIKCSLGTYCKVDDHSDEPYCQPSCDISNGGCASDEICTLVDVQCITTPCLPQAVCTKDLCSSVECTRNDRCVVDSSASDAGSALCLPSCYVENGGCSDQVCVVEMDDSCTSAPCSSLSCIRVGDYRRGDCAAGKVYQSCGSSCPASCDNLGTVLICTANCVEGCFCPSGLVEYRDRCVDPLECPTLLADPPSLNPLPLADNEVLVQLSVLNVTVDTFEEIKSSFLSSLQMILVNSGLSDARVELYAVMNGVTELRSPSQILVVVQITSDSISEEGTTADDIVTIIDRNKESLSVSVASVSSVTSPYEGTTTTDDDPDAGLSIWVIVGIVVGVAVLLAVVVVLAIVVVIVRVKRSREKLDPSSVNFSVKSSNLYGELEPELVSLDSRNVDIDMKNDLVYKE